MCKKLTLKDFGASHCSNLLNPIKCDCGCGGYMEILLSGKKERLAFARDILESIDYGDGAVFIISFWDICGAILCDDGIALLESTEPCESLEGQVESIKRIIKELDLQSIGIFQYTEGNQYRVVTNRIYDRR